MLHLQHVKKHLAAVTYFSYYGPNRVIFRENQEGHALYFLLSGSVRGTKLQYDELLKTNVPVALYIGEPGKIFGEVSLLHNIPRAVTVTTTGK